MRSSRTAARLLLAVAVTMPLGLVACTSYAEPEEIAKGVEYSEHAVADGKAYLLTVDMAQARVDVLTPGKIAAVKTPHEMGEEAGAVGVINGDFFNNDDDEQRCGTDEPCYTNAPVGPMISGDHHKASGPVGQKMGPKRPDGIETESVLGIAGSQATITELHLKSEVQSPQGTFELQGLNQYAIEENGIGAFDSSWGEAPRKRAVCGDDESREPACSPETEVLIRDDQVVSVSNSAGGNAIAANETVLLGRDDGADRLAELNEGDTVTVDYELESDASDLTAAVGGMPLIVDGETLAPQDDELAARTAVGYKDDENKLYMVVAEKARLVDIINFGKDRGLDGIVNLDGGGSSAMSTEIDGEMEARYNGELLGQRAVANALAVFAEKPEQSEETNPLEGRWTHQGDFPTDVQTLTIDADNNATFFAEGNPVDYAGTVEPGDGDNAYIVELEPTDSMPEAEDAGSLTLEFTYQDDSLLVEIEGQETVYERDETED